MLVGDFENHDYDEQGKNDWHYVSISYNHFEDNYTWSNRAGVSWTLYPTERSHVLRVGEDCPYFKDGYEISEVNQMGVYGPGMEFYSKSGILFLYKLLLNPILLYFLCTGLLEL